MTRTFSIILLVLLQSPCLLTQGRFEKHSGFSFGVEVGNYLLLSGTYPSKQLSYRLGYFTGLELHRSNTDAFHLNFEFSYSSIINHRIGVSQIFNDQFQPGLYFLISNEHFRLSFGELAIGPEYSRTILGDLALSLYGNVFVGIGKETLSVVQISQGMIVDTTGASYPRYMYGPYGEYNMGPIRFPYGYSIGVRIIWSSIMLDGRFKHTTFDNSKSIMPIPKTLFVSLGYLF